MARNLSVILILTFALSVTNPLHEVEPATAFPTTENIIPNWESSINVDLAVTTRRHHLQQLFHRYGENNSLSVEGFQKLLQNIGLDKMKRIHIHHDHEHHSEHDHHSHHNHAASSKNHRKALCPDHGSESSGKESKTSQGKGAHRSERASSRRNVLKDGMGGNKVTSTADNVISEGTHFLETIETPKPGKLLPKDLSSSTPPSITEKSQVVQLGSRKTNESMSEPRKSFMYSRNTNENAQECFNASKLLTSHGIGIQVLLNATQFSYLCPAIINQIDARSCLVHTTSEKKTEVPPKTHSLQIAWVGGFIAISIISFLSLLGVILVPLMNRVFFKFLLSFLVALAVGTLSGDAFLHLLPHSHASHHHSHSHEETVEMKRGPLFSHLSSQDLEENAYFDSTWKGLTALGGLYFMFLVEHLLTLIKQFKDKKKKNQKKPESDDDVEIKKQLSKYESQLSTNEEKVDADDRSEGYLRTDSQDPSNFDSQQPAMLEEEEVMIAHSHPQEVYNEYVPRGCKNKCHSHFHDTLGQSDDLIHHHHDYHHILHHHHHQNHHPHSHSQRYSREELKDAGIATLAWMVIMGDGLHNFSDGLAIGAAFTEGFSSGLSTSVAVFCHELPHELGDFAVLLKAGMTVKQAVLYNALSAMLAYLGMATGIFIGHYAENVSMWIFALTAGLFMYVALVDMVPEMLHNDASDHGCSRWGYFFLQNAGILLGFGIMLLISIFEHKIVFRINF